MYYLQSRYYDAKICRFINADGYVSTGQGVIGNNMFAYCNNNPVMGYDPTGEYCVANKDGTDTNYLDDWLIEGAGAGGYGGTGNYFGYGTSYYSYSIRNYSSATNNPRYYIVASAVSVNDGMAVAQSQQSTFSIINSGVSRPPSTSIPNSKYLQYDQSTGGVRSETVYDSNGNWYSRIDYMHTHNINGVDYIPHIHISAPLNQYGQPIGRERILPWYKK